MTAVCVATGNFNSNAPLTFDIRRYTTEAESSRDINHGEDVASGSTMTGTSLTFTVSKLSTGQQYRCFVSNGNGVGPYTNGNCTKNSGG